MLYLLNIVIQMASFRPLLGAFFIESSPPHPAVYACSRWDLRGKIIFDIILAVLVVKNCFNASIFKARGKIMAGLQLL